MLLFVGTLCVIYLSAYHEVYLESQEMLERHANEYWKKADLPSLDTESLSPRAKKDKDDEDHRYNLSSFYTVSFDKNGDATVVYDGFDNSDLESSGLNLNTLIDLARTIVDKDKTEGIYKSWIYYIETQDDETLVVLMDNTITNSNMFTLLQYTLSFGIIMVVFLFIISAYIAGRIVDPLEESYVKQKQFISDAGHELKTPIAVIGTNIDILERAYGSNKWLDNVKFETERMKNLVCQLLDLARAENTKLPMERLDFSRLVYGGVLPFESIAFEKERRLEIDIKDDIFVMGNKDYLGNLVSILVDNALDYAPADTNITIKLAEEKGHATLSVANVGNEIPEEDRKNLFERFYRSDSSRTGENPHYGLGLAIAKTVVVAHKGDIEVKCRDGLVIFEARIPTVQK